MIVVDGSAIVAVLLSESDGDDFQRAPARSDRSFISALNVHETAIVMRRCRGIPVMSWLWQFLKEDRIDIMAFDEAQAETAASAYERYGKGIDPKAKLNLADCAAYAPAPSPDAPLLFKGRDFAATDVKAAP